MSKEADALKLLFEAKHPEGLTATDIARVEPKWLNAPLDELEDKGIIKGKYEKIEGIWIRVYRLRRCRCSSFDSNKIEKDNVEK